MEIRYTTFSEKGIRSCNQDVYKVVVDPKQNKALFIVCDGMGGHAMGDVAAQTVCDAISSYWVKTRLRMTENPRLLQLVMRHQAQWINEQTG